MNERVTIRQLFEKDWQGFSIIRLQALKECPGNFGSTYEREKEFTPQRWIEWLGRKDGAVFGMYDGDMLIGITGIMNDAKEEATGFMIASYIKPEYRGRGLALVLNTARIEWARTYGAWKKLIVAHREDNKIAQRATQKHGFTFAYRESETWADGVTCDDIYYKLDLEKLRQ